MQGDGTVVRPDRKMNFQLCRNGQELRQRAQAGALATVSTTPSEDHDTQEETVVEGEVMYVGELGGSKDSHNRIDTSLQE